MLATTEWIGDTEYDVRRVSRLRWYYSDDDGTRYYGLTRAHARRKAVRARS
jgi:hypothetical protein